MIQRIGRLTPLAEALTAIKRCAPVEAREIATTQAEGCFLAADVVAARALPAADLALRDGWAVKAEDTRDAGPYAPMPLDPPPQRIDTFAALPPGTDAVAPPDAVTVTGGVMQIMAPVTPGEGVLPTIRRCVARRAAARDGHKAAGERYRRTDGGRRDAGSRVCAASMYRQYQARSAGAGSPVR